MSAKCQVQRHRSAVDVVTCVVGILKLEFSYIPRACAFELSVTHNPPDIVPYILPTFHDSGSCVTGRRAIISMRWKAIISIDPKINPTTSNCIKLNHTNKQRKLAISHASPLSDLPTPNRGNGTAVDRGISPCSPTHCCDGSRCALSGVARGNPGSARSQARLRSLEGANGRHRVMARIGVNRLPKTRAAL